MASTQKKLECLKGWLAELKKPNKIKTTTYVDNKVKEEW